jgi:hypothetical protein
MPEIQPWCWTPTRLPLSVPKKTWKDWVRQKTRHYSTGKYYKKSHRFLLGMYAATLFLYYPLFAATAIFFDWRWAVVPLLVRLILQGYILRKAHAETGRIGPVALVCFTGHLDGRVLPDFCPGFMETAPANNWN